MKHRILVVDDDCDIADSLVRLLHTLGYEAKAAYDGQQAIDVAADFMPDMAFIDIGMPGFDGYQTVAGIRHKHECAHAILVALTGWAQREDQQRAIQSGFDLHVAKPIQIETLNELLELLKPDTTESTMGKISKLSAARHRAGVA